MNRAGTIAALLLLLVLGGVLLWLAPSQSKVAAGQRDVMSRFMDEDYVCCDLSVARQNPRCEEVLRAVGSLSRGNPGSQMAAAASNALVNCPAAELIAMAGDPAVVRTSVQFLASKIQGTDPAAAKKAARLLSSDTTLVREAVRDIQQGKGILCRGPGFASAPATEIPCTQTPALVAALEAVFLDEKVAQTDRQKASAMLTELGPGAAAAAPALARSLESRDASVRASATTALAEMGPAAAAALPSLRRLVHREPAPGLRDQMITAIGRIDPRAGCCYCLFREPELVCAAAFENIGRGMGGTEAEANADCPAAFLIELSRDQRAPVNAMLHLGPALRAPDIATRRRAASALGIVAGSFKWRGRIDKVTVAQLREAFRSGVEGIALDAAEVLRQIEDSTPPQESAAAPEAFLLTLETEASDRRAAAAWALGQAGRRGAGAVPALRKAVDGPDEVLADAAYGALNRIAVASGLQRLGIKRDGKYEIKPEAMAALMSLSKGEPAALAR